MSAGNLISSGQRRTIRIIGEIEKPKELEEFCRENLKKDNSIYFKRHVANH